MSKNETIHDISELVSQIPFTTGIFPHEMAFLLSQIDSQEEYLIIDSGRGPDAFSTLCLNKFYQNRPNVKIFSIDWLDFKNMDFYKNNSFQSNLVFIQDNSFNAIPEIKYHNPDSNFVIIIDGPKGFKQILLSLLVIYNLKPSWIALHNINPYGESRKILDPEFKGKYLEDLLFNSKSFDLLKDKDYSLSLRSVEHSSLILIKSPEIPKKLPFYFRISFIMHNILWILKIKIQGFITVAKIFSSSLRLIYRVLKRSFKYLRTLRKSN
jgi:hypothetical protein